MASMSSSFVILVRPWTPIVDAIPTRSDFGVVLQVAVGPAALGGGLLRRRLRPHTQLLGAVYMSFRLTGLLLRVTGKLLCVPLRLLGGGPRCFGGLVREPLCLEHLLARMLDEFLRALLGLFGVPLRAVALGLNLGVGLLLLPSGTLLRRQPFALQHLLGVSLGLSITASVSRRSLVADLGNSPIGGGASGFA
jgi:hypothetical protein